MLVGVTECLCRMTQETGKQTATCQEVALGECYTCCLCNKLDCFMKSLFTHMHSQHFGLERKRQTELLKYNFMKNMSC